MTPEQQKEAIQELKEWIYTTEADVESWGPRKEHHPLWHNYRDTKNFLARLKEPEDSGYCCPACGRPYIKEPDDRCPSCGNKGEIPAFYGRGGEAFMRPCPDPWHDQKEESE
jgi:rubrerythrin